ncbi:MAG: hypothetical protein ACJASL_003956 [Paraglaciecola sp.]|jgi:hypothetical protein
MRQLFADAAPITKIILLEVMLLKVRHGQFYCLLVCLAWSIKGWCSPWIGTLEPQLHQDLQVLVEWGVLDASVSSYPVPWKGVASQLEKLQVHTLHSIPAISAQRLKHYLQAHKKQTGQSVISLYGATDNSRFTAFNGVQDKKVKLNMTKEFYAGRWAGQISANHERGGKSHFDQSFIAYQFGDWNLRVGSLNQWWGPAQSSSLIMSNNARPVPSISFSRSQATRSENKWLQYLGPWFFTAQIGQLESQRVIPDTKLWMTRFNFTPISGLELGFSWSAMWGGEGQANSVGDWFKVVTFQTECANGEATCDAALDTKLGNHIAGFDFKYSVMLFEQPFSLYGQRIGEDAVDYYRVTDNANLLGVSTYLWGSKVYIEASDTNVACGNSGSDAKNCYYEHSTYQSGYRRYDRAIGSTFETDAKMLSVGINKQFSDGDLFELVINRLTLNEDKQKPAAILNGKSEEILRLSGFYQMHYGNWLVKLGASFEHGEVDDADSETDALVFTEIKYRLY